MNILSVISFWSGLLLFIGEGCSSEKVLFQSHESKTASGGEIFNSVSFKRSIYVDVWTMDQSHFGMNSEKWDKLKIIVDREKSPVTVRYQQLDGAKNIEYKVNCIDCHSSGPRAIRAKQDNLSYKDKLSIYTWNLIIKSYGDVRLVEDNSIIRIKKLNINQEEVLKLRSCTRCHRNGAERGELSKKNIGSIKFLIKNKQMPPWPFEISNNDLEDLKKFLYH